MRGILLNDINYLAKSSEIEINPVEEFTYAPIPTLVAVSSINVV